jgi:hypothetical protein
MGASTGGRCIRLNGVPVNYGDGWLFPALAAVQAERRGGNEHECVVGSFRLVEGRVSLACVYCGAAWNLEERLTFEARDFARWRTKQAAWQWLRLRPWLDARVIHLGRLDVLATSLA